MWHPARLGSSSLHVFRKRCTTRIWSLLIPILPLRAAAVRVRTRMGAWGLRDLRQPVHVALPDVA